MVRGPVRSRGSASGSPPDGRVRESASMRIMCSCSSPSSELVGGRPRDATLEQQNSNHLCPFLTLHRVKSIKRMNQKFTYSSMSNEFQGMLIQTVNIVLFVKIGA